jgi:hypothetical protein
MRVIDIILRQYRKGVWHFENKKKSHWLFFVRRHGAYHLKYCCIWNCKVRAETLHYYISLIDSKSVAKMRGNHTGCFKILCVCFCLESMYRAVLWLRPLVADFNAGAWIQSQVISYWTYGVECDTEADFWPSKISLLNRPRSSRGGVEV